MKKTIAFVAAAGLSAVGLLTGCEWSGGGGADTVSNRYNWVSFSGVYRASTGGILVTDYTQTPETPGTTNVVSGEKVATAATGQSKYGGTLGHAGLRIGSVSINAGVFTLTDNLSGGLAGSGKVGTINYTTGAWTIDLLGEFPTAGTPIVATYAYVVEGVKGSTGANRGTTGKTIMSLVVEQSGNELKITDNNGAVYSGRFSSIRSTGGVANDDPTTGTATLPSEGDQLIGSFEASGTSAARVGVRIVGTLQGTVVTAQTGTGTAAAATIQLGNRQMSGTWIESNGRTGDVNGSATPINITVAP